jgi:hypothetical protein
MADEAASSAPVQPVTESPPPAKSPFRYMNQISTRTHACFTIAYIYMISDHVYLHQSSSSCVSYLYRHEWYQTGTHVTLSVFQKSLKPEDVDVQFFPRAVRYEFESSSVMHVSQSISIYLYIDIYIYIYVRVCVSSAAFGSRLVRRMPSTHLTRRSSVPLT